MQPTQPTRCRHASLALDSGKLFRHVHKQGVTWIDLDRVENRCLGYVGLRLL